MEVHVERVNSIINCTALDLVAMAERIVVGVARFPPGLAVRSSSRLAHVDHVQQCCLSALQPLQKMVLTRGDPSDLDAVFLIAAQPASVLAKIPRLYQHFCVGCLPHMMMDDGKGSSTWSVPPAEVFLG